MARLARMMGLGGVAALGAGLLLTAPAHAAPTPTATLTIPSNDFSTGITCTTDETAHEIQLRITLGAAAAQPTDITAFTISVNGTAITNPPAFSPNPIGAGGLVSNVVVRATGAQIDTVEAQVTIETQGEGGEPRVLNLEGSNRTAAACDNPTGTTSTTAAPGSTTSTTAGSTTSTTGGSTTSTTAGGSTTTSSTSTTLGANDTTGTLTVSPSTVAPGGSISVAGTGFRPNTQVTLTLFSDPVSLGTLTSNASGAISGSVSIPAATPTGAHKVEAKGANAAGNGNHLLRADLTVRAGSGSIPRTGGSSDFLLPVGIAVVSLGILAFAWRERRLGLR